MDNRKPIAQGTMLNFPGMECLIECEIGRGSNAIVYKGRYPDNLNAREWHTVLIKELFPCHPRGLIYRADNGSIICEAGSEALWQDHRHSFETGNRVHLRMLNSFPSEMCINFNTFSLNNTYYSILGYTGGRSMKEDQVHGLLPLRQLAERMLLILDSLSFFHDEGYLHLDIAPDNILLLGNGRKERAVLIDYNSVHSLRTDEDNPNSFSIKMGYTAPEIRSRDYSAVSYYSDIYSVTAVLYQSLTQKALTPFQMSRPYPPDVSGTPALRGQPDTVQNMVEQILDRGLATLPRFRYQSVKEMREDVEELINRIDGIGITHCALWEAGRRSVKKTVRDNPAFSYLQDEDGLFSVNAQLASGEQLPVDTCLSSLKRKDGRNLFLIGEGGSGKTTALLRFVLSSQEKYSPSQPAVIYISLFGRKHPEESLLDFILENLRFRTKTGSFSEARQILTRLLDIPLQTSGGELPALILLIDGLNEYEGSNDDLLEDIKSLGQMKGVRLLVASRSREENIPFEPVELPGLQASEVSRAVSSKGYAIPESPAFRKLLENPLMLSIFLQSAEASGNQLFISGKEELLKYYFSSLLEKEINLLPDNSDKRWLLEVSVQYVLPAIAEEIRRKRHPLSDTELLSLIEKLFDLTQKRAFFKLFPSWVGHSSSIRGGADNAEEWYGLVVHRILWKRLGLLIRFDSKYYQLPHEVILDYLSAVDRASAKKLRFQQSVRNLCAILSGLLLTGAIIWGICQSPESGKEIQRAESVNLAHKSNEALENGDRIKAVEYALEALPAHENRPFVAEAQAALAEALFAYQREDYYPVSRISQETEINSADFSLDGNLLATRDGGSCIRCYDIRSGKKLWDVETSSSDGKIPSSLLGFTENCNHVLWTNPSSLVMLNGNTGKEEKKVLFDHCGIDDRNAGSNAFFSEDRKILAVSVSNDRNGTLPVFHNDEYLVFYNTETLEVLQHTDVLPVTDRAYVKAGVFSQDNTVFWSLFHKEAEDEYVLLGIDVYSGEVLKSLAFSGINEYTEFDASLTWIDKDKETSEMLLVYVREHKLGRENGMTYIAVAENGRNDWSFVNEYPNLGKDKDYPLAAYEDPILHVFIRNHVLNISQAGYTLMDETLPANILQYKLTDPEKSEYEILLSDGTARIYSIGAPFMEETGKSPDLISASIAKAYLNIADNEMFGVIPEGQANTMIVFGWIGDAHGTKIIFPHEEKEIVGDLFVSPSGNMWVYIEKEKGSIDKTDTDQVYYRFNVALFNGKTMEYTETFSFEAPFIPTVGYFGGFSEDESVFFLTNKFKKITVDLETKSIRVSSQKKEQQDKIPLNNGKYMLEVVTDYSDEFRESNSTIPFKGDILSRRAVISNTDDESEIASFSLDRDWVFIDLQVQEDPENHRLFIYDSSMHITGLCIDMDSWTVIYRVPKMGGYVPSSSMIISCSDDRKELVYYPYYSLENLMDWAEG